MKKELKFVLLADVVCSRKIENRDDFQKSLVKVLKEINKEYNEGIYANFKILKGLDEIGAVLENFKHIYKIISRILDRIYPNSMRFALVYDYIDTALDSKDITRMDGPAFHRASEMISSLKESKSFFDMSINDEWAKPISALINLILLFKDRWTDRQHRVINEYEKELNQKKVAKKFNLTQQGVSQILNRTKWKQINNLENQLNDIICNYNESVVPVE